MACRKQTNKFKALEERKKVVVKGFLFDDVVHTLGEVKFVIYLGGLHVFNPAAFTKF
jgi:hypothetical protein